jgi:aldehyde:ferredoxin oxidoreductase
MPDGPGKGFRITNEALNKMLDEYYSLRGWDSNGIPTEGKLKELKLDFVIEDLRKVNLNLKVD